MKGKHLFVAFAATALMLSSTMPVNAQRKMTNLRDGWRFTHEDKAEQSTPTYNDKRWLQVSVPHDWAISGPFDKEIDKQVVAIVQNGEKEATEKTGRSGALPWIGTGWYRTHFKVDKGCERAILNFDGAMAEPVVYVNGQKAGEWKYGYSAFNVDITPYVHADGSDNVLAVRLQNVEESSRWYPGAGLYRPVTLIQTGKTAIEEWGTEFDVISINKSERTAAVRCKSKVIGELAEGMKVAFRFHIGGATPQVLSATVHDGVAEATGTLTGVEFWSPESPKLYRLETVLSASGKDIDSQETKVGVRTIKCSAEGGFQLNGITRKFKGVCLHHDLGMLGAAVNKAALIRQVNLLKSMGCDAIRTSHNMPSQMQMDVCDSLGMMVMAESFDMWIYPKCKNGYARFFKEWGDRDIENLVRANRLHPSIVMWSVGNEIPEQGMKDGAQILRHLQEVVHRYDISRPITNGMDRIDNALQTGFAQVAEVPGMNYRTHKYKMAYEKLGQGYVLGSETASTVSSRGVYKFPLTEEKQKMYDDGQCSSYDLTACSWSNLPEYDWELQDDCPWVIGEFVWTGFDYLGEPTPYDGFWPSRSSYFGIFDLAGLPKDRYYLYRSKWNTSQSTIHLLPHWTWPGREGEVTPVFCYTNYPTAELFVNGKSQGKISKDPSRLMYRYRLRWDDVKYEPGELRVVVYDAQGNKAGEQIVKTAGAPDHVELAVDRKSIVADGDDMSFVTARVVDKDGNLCPDADNQLTVTVSGKTVKFRGICNGDATSLESFVKPTMKAFHGELVIGVQSTGMSGDALVTVSGKGVKSERVSINAK